MQSKSIILGGMSLCELLVFKWVVRNQNTVTLALSKRQAMPFMFETARPTIFLLVSPQKPLIRNDRQIAHIDTSAEI